MRENDLFENKTFLYILYSLMAVALGSFLSAGFMVVKQLQHNCTIAGHECPVTEVEKEVVKVEECKHNGMNIANTTSATLAEKACLLVIDNLNIRGYTSDARKEAQRLEEMRMARATEKFQLAELHVAEIRARAALKDAEARATEAAQNWIVMEAEWSADKEQELEAHLQRLQHMKMLAMSIKQQNDQLKELIVEVQMLEDPTKPPVFGGGGKHGAKNMKELREREAAYFGR